MSKSRTVPNVVSVKGHGGGSFDITYETLVLRVITAVSNRWGERPH